ncbi:MAG: ABC transporter substrate-binding protein [Burkholderiales bacterium]|nr:ABC transporter substrate-binding protein [Burkholderiales bacterium]
MNRREGVLALLALGAAPLAAYAQQPRRGLPRIGFLISETLAGQASRVEALRAGLRELGYVEGETIAVDVRTADGEYDRLPALAQALVDRKVDVIVTFGVKAAVAAKRVTKTIPLVIPATADPIASGLVKSLARPDANITGSAIFGLELNAKRLALLKEVAPRIVRAGVLVNPVNASVEPSLKAMQPTGQTLGVELRVVEARTPGGIDSAFAKLAHDRADALVVQQDTLFAANHERIARLAAGAGIPSVGNKEYAEAGGLLGYGASDAALYRRGAYFVDRILKGARPADLPFERASEFELVVNMKAARALRLEVPRTVLLGADRVIE